MIRSSATVTLILLASGALADPAGDVRCREIGFSEAAESRNSEAFRSFIDEDARFVSNRVSRGPVDIAESWSGILVGDRISIKWRPQFVEVLDSGDLALSRGPYRLITIGDDGEERVGWGTYNSVWRKASDGEWYIVFDAGSNPTETPSDEQRALLDEEHGCSSDTG